MKFLILVALCILTSSCIPLKVAPTIEDHQIILAKKFNRKLPDQYAFVFEDPKDANEFYNFLNITFQRNHTNVDWQVPFEVDKKQYYLAFFEIEKIDKTLNLIPIVIDASIDDDCDPMLEDLYTSRSGKWFIVITAVSEDSEDCLHPNYDNREAVINYLKQLKSDYLRTKDYNQLLLQKKP